MLQHVRRSSFSVETGDVSDIGAHHQQSGKNGKRLWQQQFASAQQEAKFGANNDVQEQEVVDVEA